MPDAPPDVGAEEVISGETPVEEAPEEKSSDGIKGSVPAELTVLLERIQTQIHALNEVREATNERFVRMSEQIGEIRSMVIEGEKNMRDIEVKATLASDLVKEVQPQTLQAEVMKLDGKVESLKALIEAHKSVNESIIDELKGIKLQMGLFKGTDAILKLNEDTKTELLNIQKIKAMAETHANKVEQIFVDIQKNFADFQKLGNQVENVLASNSSLQKEVGSLKLKFETMISKRELDDMNKQINGTINMIHAQAMENAKTNNLISVLKTMEEKLFDLIQQDRKEIQEIKKDNNKAKKSVVEVYDFLGRITEKLNKRISGKELEDIRKDLKNQEKQISQLLGVIEALESKLLAAETKKKK